MYQKEDGTYLVKPGFTCKRCGGRNKWPLVNWHVCHTCRGDISNICRYKLGKNPNKTEINYGEIIDNDDRKWFAQQIEDGDIEVDVRYD